MKAEDVLKKVKRDYTAIAEAFDETRQAPWPEFALFFEYLKKNFHGESMNLLDVGCGNGRLLAFLHGTHAPIRYTGLDNNRKLLGLAQKNHPNANFHFGDVLKLPFSKASFDSAWCIAVLHHLPAKSMQKKAIQELRRVVHKNGFVIVTAWNLWHDPYKKFIQSKTQHALIPWKKDKKRNRYYYAFQENELRGLLKEAGFAKIQKIPSVRNFAFICS